MMQMLIRMMSMVVIVFMIMRVSMGMTVLIGVGMGMLVDHAFFMDMVFMLMHIDCLRSYHSQFAFRRQLMAILPASSC